MRGLRNGIDSRNDSVKLADSGSQSLKDSAAMHRLLLFSALLTTAPPGTTEITVTASGDGDSESIQAAIDADQPGALIRVAAGTYRENISIDKPVQLVGAGWNRTRVELPGNTEPTLEASWDKWIAELKKVPHAERHKKPRTFEP